MATPAVKEVWRLRKGVKHTAAVAPMAGFVVDNTVEVAAESIAMLRAGNKRAWTDQMCECGFTVCAKRGPCAPKVADLGTWDIKGQANVPNDPERPNLLLSVDSDGKHRCVCTRCDWKAVKWGSRVNMLANYDHNHKCPADRFMSRDLMQDTFHCSDCAWHSGKYSVKNSEPLFRLHVCDEWPAGTMIQQWRCGDCRQNSPPSPTIEQALAWGKDHVCSAFVVGDMVLVAHTTPDLGGWSTGRGGVVGDIDIVSGTRYYRVDIDGDSRFHPASDLEHAG